MDKVAFKTDILNKIKMRSSDESIRSVLFKYKQLGMDKDTMYNCLESLRSELRENGDELSEEKIMDYMDYVVGWCSPNMRIYP